MIASLKVIFLASCVTQPGVNVMIIGGSETFARLQMSVNQKKSFAYIVRTVHPHYFSSCRSVHHVLNLSCLGRYSQTRIKHYLCNKHNH